jgi:hypothetical protein
MSIIDSVEKSEREMCFSEIIDQITSPNKFFPRSNSVIFDRFCASAYDSVLEIFPARQDFR